MSWRREPLVWFLLLSAAVFAVYPLLLSDPSGHAGKIVVTAGQIEMLKDGFRRTWQRGPDDAEVRNLIEEDVRTEILAREAVAMGLDRDDNVIRRHLQTKLESIADSASRRAPTDAELSAFLAAHSERFREEPRFTFRQVSFSPDRHGDRLDADVQSVLADLKARGAAADVSKLGDSLMLENDYDRVSRTEATRLFGEDFARALATLEPGGWRGPLPSGYGVHLVFLARREEGRMPPLEEIRRSVELEWEARQAEAGKSAFYERLRERYRIRFDLPDEAASVKPGG